MKPLLNPLLHNELCDISEVQTIKEDDIECLNEIKKIITKHGKERKLGIALLHKHFNISDEEVLVETISTKDRILTTKPISLKEAGKKSLVQTVWCFSSDKSFAKSCESFCPTGPTGKHYGNKDHY